MMFWLPRFLICSCASKLAPSPMASMAITEQTPNTIPSTVSSERRRCSQRLRTPSRIARSRRVSAKRRGRFDKDELGLAADIAFYAAIAEPNRPTRMSRNIVVVGDQNQRLALFVEFIEKPQDFCARSGVQISRGLVRQDYERIVH